MSKYVPDPKEVVERFRKCQIKDYEESLIESEIISVSGIPNVSKELCSIGGKRSYKNKVSRGEYIGFDGWNKKDHLEVCRVGARILGKNKGYTWWYNGETYKFCKEQPMGYYRYHAPNNPGYTTKDTVWWNDGKRNKRSKERPGPEWVKGRTKSNFGPKPGTKCWWTNSTDSVLSEECPGENWYKGRVINTDK